MKSQDVALRIVNFVNLLLLFMSLPVVHVIVMQTLFAALRGQ